MTTTGQENKVKSLSFNESKSLLALIMVLLLNTYFAKNYSIKPKNWSSPNHNFSGFFVKKN
jgi:hypothetical protein